MWKLPTIIENEIPAAGYLGNKEGTLEDNFGISAMSNFCYIKRFSHLYQSVT